MNKEKIIWMLMLVSFIVLLFVPVLRFINDKPILAEDMPYYHVRMAEHISENGIPIEDPFADRPYMAQPYHLMLAYGSKIFGFGFLSIIIPLICGLISILVLYFILKEFEVDYFNRAVIIFTSIASPLFVFLFSTSNEYAVIVMLTILGFYLFMQKKFFIPSFLIFSLMPFFGIIPSVISLSMILVYSLNNKKKLKYFYVILGAIVIIYTAYQSPLLYHYGFPNRPEFTNSNLITNVVADFGAKIGQGIFNIVLAIAGLFVFWKIKKQLVGYILFLALFVLSFYNPEVNAYLSFIVAIFAGYGFVSLIRMKWKIDLIKKLTIILIICGILFSTLSYINRVSNSLPDTNVIESLEWLKEHSNEEDIVFSHYSKGNWIEIAAKRPVILDSQFEYTRELNNKLNFSNVIFYSRNLRDTRDLLNEHKIKYIWIDESMKQGQVWVREEQGLLFLFRNKETFNQIYDKNGIEIWEFLD